MVIILNITRFKHNLTTAFNLIVYFYLFIFFLLYFIFSKDLIGGICLLENEPIIIIKWKALYFELAIAMVMRHVMEDYWNCAKRTLQN